MSWYLTPEEIRYRGQIRRQMLRTRLFYRLCHYSYHIVIYLACGLFVREHLHDIMSIFLLGEVVLSL